MEVPKRERFCLNCKTAFKADMSYISSVNSESYDCWQRQDFCKACWEEGALQKPLSVASWRSEVPKRQEELDLELEKNEQALGLLLNFYDGKNPGITAEEAFFLALYLVRKKILIVKNTIKTKALSRSSFLVKKTGQELLLSPIAWKSIDPLAMQKRLEAILTKSP